MTEHLLIGIDLGTTNGKIVCYDSSGHLQAEAASGYPTHYPQPGYFEQDPGDWLAAIEKGLHQISEKLGPRTSQVAGMAVSTFGPGLVIVDDAGQPLAPCPTWQDNRCRPQGKRLVEEVGDDWIGLGAPFTGFPARVLWAIEEQPNLVKNAAYLLDIKSFLMQWLTGVPATDPSSGPGRPNWYGPVFEAAGWPQEKLPAVLSATDQVGGLREGIAQRVGLPAGIPVFAGINDGAASTLSTGTIQPGSSVVTLATNGVCRLVVQERLDGQLIQERMLFSWPYIDNYWICGGFTFSGASSLQWLADQFGLERDSAVYDRLLAEAEQVPIGSRGVLFLPYLAGRGTPQAESSLRGALLNLSFSSGRGDLTRAVLEGTAFALAEIFLEFKRLNFNIGPVSITGGGAQSRLWRQIVADVLDRSVTKAGGEATLGNAMIAGVGLGIFPDFETAAEKMVQVVSCQEPNPGYVEAYRKCFDFFTSTRDTYLHTPRASELVQTLAD